MLRQKALLALLTLCLGLPFPPAAAQDRSSGHWKISDNAAGAGCLVSLTNASDQAQGIIFFAIGYAPRSKDFLVMHAGAKLDLKNGRRYDVALRFDDDRVQRLAMTAGNAGRNVMLETSLRDPSTLFEALAGRREVTFEHETARLGPVPLVGGAEALAALRDCQARHEGSAPRPQAQPQAPPQAAPANPGSGFLWRTLGDWQIHRFTSGTCVAITAGDGGLILSLRLHADTGNVSFILAHRAWRSIKSRQLYAATLRLPPSSPLSLNLTGDNPAGGGVASVSAAGLNRTLLDQIARASTLQLDLQGEGSSALDLTGSSAAIAAMLDCQRQGGAATPPAPTARPATPAPPPGSGPIRESAPPRETAPQR